MLILCIYFMYYFKIKHVIKFKNNIVQPLTIDNMTIQLTLGVKDEREGLGARNSC